MKRYLTSRRALRGLGLAALVALLPLQSCSDVLEVTDPDIILEVGSFAGAIALKNGALDRLHNATAGIEGPDNLFVFGGLLADEWRSGDTFVQRNNMDQRIFEPTNTFHAGLYRELNRVRVEASRAIAALRTYAADSVALVGQMFAITALSEALIGEHYCNGTPLSTVEGASIVYGDPITNDSIFGLAIAHADSALANAAGRARVINLAAIVKGRALLDRNQFAAAQTAVAAVPLTYKYHVYYSTQTGEQNIWGLNNGPRRYTMIDREGGNGLDYLVNPTPATGANGDPRLPWKTGPDRIFDSAFPLLITYQGMWSQYDSVAVATGIEAQLITAEAQFRAANAAWLGTLNALRTNTALYPPVQSGFLRGPTLTALADPGTDSLRINTIFRERAFWMFSTGHRLGDLRRLVRQYNRAVDGTFPVGAYLKGGNYGSAVNLPVPFQETNNPQFSQCIDEKA